MATFIQIELRYNAGGQEEILCNIDDYNNDTDLFLKDYKKLLHWLNKDHYGAGLVRASKFLKCDDIFISNHNLMSIKTNVITIDIDGESSFDEPIEDPIYTSLQNIKLVTDTSNKILNKLESIDSKIEKPKKKPLVEGKKNGKTNNKV